MVITDMSFLPKGIFPTLKDGFSGILADYATERKAESVWKYMICRFRQL